MRSLLPCLLGLGIAASACAHRLDEYLQSSTLSIEKSQIGVHIEMAPGVEVAAQVIRMIDKDADGVFSRVEQEAYAALTKGEMRLSIDARDAGLRLISLQFPDAAQMRDGTGKIRLDFEADSRPVGPTHHLVLENRHLKKISIYTMNSSVPARGEVEVTRQSRSVDQSLYEVDFTVQSHDGGKVLIAAGIGGLAFLAARVILRLRKRRVGT